MGEHPLTGITVLDFGQIYNGPYCGSLLAGAGARVIKVESPRGEGLRGIDPKSSETYPFCMLNGNKETITLNFKTAEGRDLLKRLAERADVLVENFAPGTLAKYGVGSDVLCEINPRLIYAMSTGFGQTGPYRDYLAMDVTVQAMTGVVAITGHDGDPPTKSGPALCDILGGVHLYGAIVSALYRRMQTGEGAVLDVAMQDTVYPTLCSALGAYYKMGGNPPRVGNHHQARSIAPYNVYATNDGFVAIICIREGHWRKLANAMGRAELLDDPRFADMSSRSRNMEETDAVVEEWTSSLTSEEVFVRCQEFEIPCAPVRDLDDVLNDPHLIQRGALQRVAHPLYGEVMLPTTPLRFTDVEPIPPTLPRAVGASNKAVYGQLLGITEDELSDLRDRQAI